MRRPVAAILFFALSVLVIEICALPTPVPPSKATRPTLAKNPGGGSEEQIALLDGFAYPDGDGYNGALEFYTYVDPKQDKDKTFSEKLKQALKHQLGQVLLHLPGVGNIVKKASDRLKLFFVRPTGGAVSATAGSQHVTLEGGGRGITMQTVKLGKVSGNVQLSAQGGHESATLYVSESSGFGVISDIDDTVKISNVLSPLKVAKATLIDPPTAVKGMPELYASLAKSLHSPLFVYLSGSPFQLYPFLRDFIHSLFFASRGPIVLQKLRPGDFSWLKSDASAIQAYKVKTFDEVLRMYPKKQFMLVGDSGQKDPEAYGQIYRAHPDNVLCVWIRRINHRKADNSKKRFQEAFQDVPTTKLRVFTDKDLATMQRLDVANGQC